MVALSVFTLAAAGLALAYAGIMLGYWYQWKRLSIWKIPRGYVPKTSVSVVIPARNEAGNIAACLHSVLQGSYPEPLLEVLVVDDFSTDDTARIVLQTAAVYPQKHIRLLRLADYTSSHKEHTSGKKQAIELAVAQAHGDLIVTTDADCVAPPGWLLSLTSMYEATAARAIAGPVMIHREQGLLQRFQALDLAGMMGITGAGIATGRQHLANGANLAYSKMAFETVDGYADSASRASGDDVFLLQKIARHWPGEVLFLKNVQATVRTEAMPDMISFFQQRLRWGTKNASLPETPVRVVLAVVFCFCWSIFLSLVLCGWFSQLIGLFVFQVAVKAWADYLLLRDTCRFFERRDLLRWFWPSFFLHTAYVVVVGTGSLFIRRYRWKGRLLR